MSETDFSDIFDAMSKGYLEHHGVKGMKWGVRRTPEQLGYKTSKKRKTSSIISKLRKNSKKKAAKAQKTKEEKKEESREEIRAKLLKSTDPKYISKHVDLLDTRELQERIDRIEKENKVKNLASSKESNKIKKGEDTLRSIANMAESVSKVFGAYEKITGKKIDDANDSKQLKQKALEKAINDLNKSTDMTKLDPSKLAKGLETFNKVFESTKDLSNISVKFNPTTGEAEFTRKAKKK